MDRDTPTPAQIEQARREADPMPAGWYLAWAIVAVSVCAALVLLGDLARWLLAPGETL